jgi:hypothetical protein
MADWLHFSHFLLKLERIIINIFEMFVFSAEKKQRLRILDSGGEDYLLVSKTILTDFKREDYNKKIERTLVSLSRV